MTWKYRMRAKRRRSAHHDEKVRALIKHMAGILERLYPNHDEARAQSGDTP